MCKCLIRITKMVKNATRGRRADCVLFMLWLAVLVCNCITLLTRIIPISATGDSKIRECTLFIRFEDGEQMLDAYGSNICIYTIVAPSIVGLVTLKIVSYLGIKICLKAKMRRFLECLEIPIAVISFFLLLIALSNACIITFGFISYCWNIVSTVQAQACGSGLWAIITTGSTSTYDTFDTLKAELSSSWIAVIILIILNVLYIIRGTVYFRKKLGYGLSADGERSQEIEARSHRSNAHTPQEFEDRNQKSKESSHKSEERSHKSNIPSEKSKARSQESELHLQNSESRYNGSNLRSHISNTRTQKSEERSHISNAHFQEFEERSLESVLRLQNSEAPFYGSKVQSRESKVQSRESKVSF